MKHFLLAALLLIFCSDASYAQYPVVGLPGATFDQIMDTFTAHTDPTDTLEGGAQDQLISFRQLWQGRVSINDGSGTNMFQQYVHELGSVIAARTSGATACTEAGFTGAWEVAGPDMAESINVEKRIEPSPPSLKLWRTMNGANAASGDNSNKARTIIKTWPAMIPALGRVASSSLSIAVG